MYYVPRINGVTSRSIESALLILSAFVPLLVTVTGQDPSDCRTIPTLPKTLGICNQGLPPWVSANAFLSDQDILIEGRSRLPDGSKTSVIRVSDEGLSMWSIYADAVETGLRFVLNDPNRLLVESGDETGITFGVLDASKEFKPIFLHQVTGDANSSFLFPTGTNKFLLFQDLGQEVELIVFSHAGKVEWAKRYSIEGYDGQGFPLAVPASDGGYFLQIADSLIESDYIILVRFDAGGRVRWARRMIDLPTSSDPQISHSLPQVSGDSRGLFLASIHHDHRDLLNPKSWTEITTLDDNNGELLKSFRISAELTPAPFRLPNGRLLFPGQGAQGPSLVLLDDNFMFIKAVSFNASNGGQIFPYTLVEPAAGKLYLTKSVHNWLPVPSTQSYFGVADFGLSEFEWRRCEEERGVARITPCPIGSRVLYSNFREEDGELDLAWLSPNLDASNDCPRLVTSPLQVEEVPVEVTPLPLPLIESPAVESRSFSPNIVSADLVLAPFQLYERPMCEVSRTSENLAITRESNRNVRISFIVDPKWSYTIQEYSTFQPRWRELETINGQIGLIEREYFIFGTSLFRLRRSPAP